MNDYWLWWIFAAVTIAVELVLGTYYLLAVGVAFALGGLAALFGATLPVQLTVAGVLAVVLTMIAHRWRLARAVPADPSLDLGGAVRVLDWKDDGTARVSYRGTQWDAELAPGSARADTMYIVATRGSTLVIAERRS
ncbi:MAG: NfeD family protein [Burkholderiales bacterium]|nr:NfeD family protein [Burkholderiales bacterium]